MRIGIVEYGVGNLTCVYNAFYNLGFDPEFVSTPEEVLAVDRLVLPGVGTPKPALAGLAERNLGEALDEAVTKKGAPIMGICLGMQLMCETLNEYGQHKGLGWIPGRSVHLTDLGVTERTPHMGWAQVTPKEGVASPLSDIGGRLWFYYAHSFVVQLDDAEHQAASSTHGAPFTAAILKDNIFACQFHPEKSQAKGEKVLERFVEWEP